MKILKAILLISAFVALVLRFFGYKYAEMLGDKVTLFNIIAVVSSVICVVCALIWVCILKKEEKANKDKTDEE